MNGALFAPDGESCERRRRRAVVLLCSHPIDAEMRDALDALGELADTTVASEDDATRMLADVDPDVIIADELVGTTDGRRLLARATRIRPDAVGILLASSASTRVDGLIVLPKPLDRRTVGAVCALALDCAALRRRVRTLEVASGDVQTAATPRSADEGDELECYDGILAYSAAMRTVVGTLRELETSDVTVLIQGETGTGKELVARAIHARSRRQRGPFVPVNLGAISDHLRESELFGHVRGAFTGASGTRGGLFLGADGGCLFLDEVGEASPALQVALLRVLEEGTITPVGADRSRRVDVRVISATNQNLAQLVRLGRFRRDLYYRLNVFPVRLPPLRERIADMFPLANHFLQLASRRLGRKAAGISHEARLALEAYPWEGNVRELRSVMERATVVSKGGLIVAADLPLADDGDTDEPQLPKIDVPNGSTLRDVEREILQKTLALAEGNQSEAARMLGLHESTLRFRMRRAGIPPPKRPAARKLPRAS
jgi:DNA-binding NtrC family response regulator